MNAKITITGATVCPACQMVGHDGDSCRANQLSDGRVMCVTCGSFIAPFEASARSVYTMPYQIKTLVAAMLRERTVGATSLKLTAASFGPDGSSSQAAYACAQGNEGVILNGGRLMFSADPTSHSKLDVRFQADELKDVPADFTQNQSDEPDQDSRQILRDLSDRNCPPALLSAIGRLVSIGFTVRFTDFTGAFTRRIQLHCGGNIAGTSVPKGIMVEATYLV